ncbi:MAG: phosphatidate cytidylyltransferase, partial [Bacteroidetes bacterium]|nr:phosphatidate cytidylyltransferase [Bacteroidota bacterium]
MVVSVWGLYEFYKISEKLGAKPFVIVGMLGGVIIYFLGVVYAPIAFFFLPLHYLALFFFTVLIVALFSSREKPVQDALYTMAGVIYAVLPFVFLNRIGCIDLKFGDGTFTGRYNYNPHFILGPILLIWANDTFAYLCGSLLGK